MTVECDGRQVNIAFTAAEAESVARAAIAADSAVGPFITSVARRAARGREIEAVVLERELPLATWLRLVVLARCEPAGLLGDMEAARA